MHPAVWDRLLAVRTRMESQRQRYAIRCANLLRECTDTTHAAVVSSRQDAAGVNAEAPPPGPPDTARRSAPTPPEDEDQSDSYLVSVRIAQIRSESTDVANFRRARFMRGAATGW